MFNPENYPPGQSLNTKYILFRIETEFLKIWPKIDFFPFPLKNCIETFEIL